MSSVNLSYFFMSGMRRLRSICKNWLQQFPNSRFLLPSFLMHKGICFLRPLPYIKSVMIKINRSVWQLFRQNFRDLFLVFGRNDDPIHIRIQIHRILYLDRQKSVMHSLRMLFQIVIRKVKPHSRCKSFAHLLRRRTSPQLSLHDQSVPRLTVSPGKHYIVKKVCRVFCGIPLFFLQNRIRKSPCFYSRKQPPLDMHAVHSLMISGLRTFLYLSGLRISLRTYRKISSRSALISHCRPLIFS